MGTVKQEVLDLARNLPDECSWDDVMYQLYVRQKIALALKEADEGRLVPHEEVFREFEG